MSTQKLKDLLEVVADKSHFKKLEDFYIFSLRYLEFIKTGLQAKIVAQNEIDYIFFQYKKEGCFNISRPINSKLFLSFPAHTKAIEKLKNQCRGLYWLPVLSSVLYRRPYQKL